MGHVGSYASIFLHIYDADTSEKMFGGMAFMAALYIYKPDSTVQTWAMAEAKKKIEAEGGLPKYEKTV